MQEHAFGIYRRPSGWVITWKRELHGKEVHEDPEKLG